MGIFGTAAPKFVFDNGGSGEATILLDYARITKDEPDPRVIRHESIVDGHRVYVEKGKYWLFEVELNLFKYSDPLGKYNNIKAFEGEQVTLWRHRDGEQFKKAGGSDCLFRIMEVTAFAIENVQFRDRLLIKFESVDFVDEAGSTVIVPQATDVTVLSGE